MKGFETMTHHKTEYKNNKPEKGHGDKKTYNQKFQRKTPKRITPSYLHNSGLYYLERFAASKKHFITVMTRKAKRSSMHHKDQDMAECVKMINELADKFERCGLLNDDIYTDGLVSSLRRKGLSRNAILTKMLMKGIDKDKTLTVLNKLDLDHHEDHQTAEKAAALKIARKKKIGPYYIKDDEQDIRKSLSKLARAGFSYDIAQYIVKMTTDDLDNLDSI